MNIKSILKKLAVWRLFLLIVAASVVTIVPFKDSFPYRESVLEPYGSPLLYSWGNFDGVHYLGIAQNGYFANFTQAFFPVYPFLTRFVSIITNNYLISGLLISHLSLVFALYFLVKLIRLDHSQKIATQTIIYLLVFPTSFFFGAIYTESFFLLLVVLSFYLSRKNKPYKAALVAAVASATRVIGIFLLPSLLWEQYLKSNKKQNTNPKYITKHYFPTLFSATGLLAYMYYLQQNFSDAFYFLNAQPAFGASRSADKLILLYQVIYRYTRMVITVDPKSILFFTVSQEFIFSMLFLGLSLLAFKKTRISYAIFGFLSFITPTLTGTFSSMPRYTLLLFPSFIVLSQIKNKLFKKIWITISVILLIINTILFTRGYWVA